MIGITEYPAAGFAAICVCGVKHSKNHMRGRSRHHCRNRISLFLLGPDHEFEAERVCLKLLLAGAQLRFQGCYRSVGGAVGSERYRLASVSTDFRPRV